MTTTKDIGDTIAYYVSNLRESRLPQNDAQRDCIALLEELGIVFQHGGVPRSVVVQIKSRDLESMEAALEHLLGMTMVDTLGLDSRTRYHDAVVVLQEAIERYQAAGHLGRERDAGGDGVKPVAQPEHRDARVLSIADVENCIVDAIETGSKDYQQFEWGPVNDGIERLRALVATYGALLGKPWICVQCGAHVSAYEESHL